MVTLTINIDLINLQFSGITATIQPNANSLRSIDPYAVYLEFTAQSYSISTLHKNDKCDLSSEKYLVGC